MQVTAGPDGFVSTSGVAEYPSHVLLTEYLKRAAGERRPGPRMRVAAVPQAAVKARACGADPRHSCTDRLDCRTRARACRARAVAGLSRPARAQPLFRQPALFSRRSHYVAARASEAWVSVVVWTRGAVGHLYRDA